MEAAPDQQPWYPDPWAACAHLSSQLHALSVRHAALQEEHDRVVAGQRSEGRAEAVRAALAAAERAILLHDSTLEADARAAEKRAERLQEGLDESARKVEQLEALLRDAERRNEHLREALAKRTEENTKLFQKLRENEVRARATRKLEAELKEARDEAEILRAAASTVSELRSENEKLKKLSVHDSRRLSDVEAEYIHHADNLRDLLLGPRGAISACMDELTKLELRFEEGSEEVRRVHKAQAAVLRARSEAISRTSYTTHLAKLFKEMFPLVVDTLAPKRDLDVAIDALRAARERSKPTADPPSALAKAADSVIVTFNTTQTAYHAIVAKLAKT